MKNYSVYLYLFLQIGMLLIFSCTSPNDSQIDKANQDLFPLSIGNSWTYHEEFTSFDSSYSSYTVDYKTTIDSIKEVGGFSWYKLETPKIDWTQSRYLMSQNDSIYELQYNWNNPVPALSYIIPVEKKEEFSTTMGGDVGKTITVYSLDTIIVTDAGNFKNCIMFEYTSPDWIEREILALGVGIIEKQMIGYSFITGEKEFVRIEKLISYNIN